MKCYGISEEELNFVGHYNTLSTVMFSLFSGFITFALGVIANYSMTNAPKPEGVVLYKVGVPIFIALAIIALGIAIYSVCKKGTVIKHMKEQSEITGPPSG
jgi:uncharacterized membrane protein